MSTRKSLLLRSLVAVRRELRDGNPDTLRRTQLRDRAERYLNQLKQL